MTEDEAKLKSLNEKLSELESRITQLEGLVTEESPRSTHKKLALREFVLSKKPTSAVQTALVIAFYLENYEGKDSFSMEDLREGFRRAKEPIPKNPSDMILKNAKKAFFDQVGEKKEGGKVWALTNSGMNEVENMDNKG